MKGRLWEVKLPVQDHSASPWPRQDLTQVCLATKLALILCTMLLPKGKKEKGKPWWVPTVCTVSVLATYIFNAYSNPKRQILLNSFHRWESESSERFSKLLQHQLWSGPRSVWLQILESFHHTISTRWHILTLSLQPSTSTLPPFSTLLLKHWLKGDEKQGLGARLVIWALTHRGGLGDKCLSPLAMVRNDGIQVRAKSGFHHGVMHMRQMKEGFGLRRKCVFVASGLVIELT